MSKEQIYLSVGSSENVEKPSSRDTSSSKKLEANCSLEAENPLKYACTSKPKTGDVTETSSGHIRTFQFSNIESIEFGDMYLYQRAVINFGREVADYLAKHFGWQVKTSGPALSLKRIGL